MSTRSSPQDGEVDDDASYLSYFSSFNRQSFETNATDATAANDAVTTSAPLDIPTDDRVPHPPMRSTITPINIALPSHNDTPPNPVNRRGARRSAKKAEGGSSSKSSNPSPNPLLLTTGPVASLVSQHNHTMTAQLRNAQCPNAPAMPTIVLQPVLMNLSQEQQVIAAQLQEQFFRLVSNAGKSTTGPLAVVAPNMHNLPSQHQSEQIQRQRSPPHPQFNLRSTTGQAASPSQQSPVPQVALHCVSPPLSVPSQVTPPLAYPLQYPFPAEGHPPQQRH